MIEETGFDLKKYLHRLQNTETFTLKGRISQVVGLTVESNGPRVGLGELCVIRDPALKSLHLPCEVVGFRGRKTCLCLWEK